MLAELPRAKVSVAPGTVAVIAVADSDADRAKLEARLRRAAPDRVALALDISAPRPVISPFAFDVTLGTGAGTGAGTGTLAACTAATPEAADAIVADLHAAGLADAADCRVGLGTPSPDWTAAVRAGLAALKTLGGGRFSLTDLSAELTPPDGTPADRSAAAAATLAAALPDGFALKPLPPPAPAPGTPVAAVLPQFDADLHEDGTVRLSGPVKDATSRAAILSYAASLFGHDQVSDATVIDAALPEGWPGRVLAGVEALAALQTGKLDVTPDHVTIQGWGLDPQVADKVRAVLVPRVGDAAVIDVSFNFRAAAAAAEAARPRPEICADQISAILDADGIQFAAGSATIVPESRGVIAAIADVLRSCPGADFEIGGHTDSQGTAEANRTLSEARAGAVLTALRAEDLPLVRLTARGFGADDPVADNASDAGRAENRRIEFTLVAPDDAAAEVLDPGADAGPEATEEAADDAATECATSIAATLAATSIQFDAGSATLTPESSPVIASIADTLRGCPDAAFEVGGYTDSQGSDSGNLRLSEERAEAVLTALRTPDLPLPGLAAKGHGEADPVADNATAAGRAANRRIVFTPIATPAPAAVDAAAADSPDAACGARIETILAGGQIQFAVSAATITPESRPVIDAIAAVLRTCPDVAMEIGGYTNSVGSDTGNETLSQTRADAVLAALRAEGLALPEVTAHGYGEADPVADNATAEGRAQNRRIAFNLVTAEGDAEEGDAGDTDGPE